jgi:glycosyltransferase involved in cell wall biosynthesis
VTPATLAFAPRHARRYRLAVVTSHPIQYQAPWFRALDRETDLHVFFCHRQDAAAQAAAGFGVEFEWDVPLLDGYQSTWLENKARRPDVSRFNGCHTPEIGERLRSGGFDACIVSGWYLRSYLQAMAACRRAGIPVLVRGDSQLATGRSLAWTMLKYLPYRALLGAIDAHLYVGRANREYLEHYGVPADRLFFAPHFVDNAFFSTRAQHARATGAAAAVRRQMGIDSGATVFAFAGKLIDKKRPADFVDALADVRGRGLDAWALVIGAGPLQAALEQRAAARNLPVRFAGFRNQTELPAYFAAADALVLPSDGGETWGLVVNEAMACGLPAIISDACGCARDLADTGTAGVVYPCGDVAALADAMAALHSDLAARRPEIGAAVAQTIAKYSLEAAVDGTLEALGHVAGRGSRGRGATAPRATAR